jgi:hypothetical protein
MTASINIGIFIVFALCIIAAIGFGIKLVIKGIRSGKR